MCERLIIIRGARPSFRESAGEVMARIEVEGWDSEYLLDRERERVRIEAIPTTRDLEKWISPCGLLSAARHRFWGLRVVEDRYPTANPPPIPRSGIEPKRPRAPRDPIRPRGLYLRAEFPRDVCTCLRCRDVVIVRRDPRSGRPIRLGAPGGWWPRVVAALDWFGGMSGVQGPGAAGVEHGRECLAWDLSRPGPIPRGRRRRAMLLDQLLALLRGDPAGRELIGARA